MTTFGGLILSLTAACTGGQPSLQPTGLGLSATTVVSRTSPPGTAGSTQPTSARQLPADDPRAGSVVRGYQAYWSTFLVLADPATPDRTRLAANATGSELDRGLSVLQARKLAREAVRGQYQHSATVTIIGASTATVADCLTDRTSVYDLKTKKRKATDPAGPFSVSVSMTLIQGAWKVSQISPSTGGCSTSTASPTHK